VWAAKLLTIGCLIFVMLVTPFDARGGEVEEAVKIMNVTPLSKDIVRALVRITPDKHSQLYKSERDLLKKSFDYTEYLIEINCRESAVCLLKIAYLEGTGNVIYSSLVDRPRWTPVVKGSTSELFKKVLCERQQKK
jgi:hypothetical protein